MTRKQLYTMLSAALYKAAPSTLPTNEPRARALQVSQHSRDAFHVAEELKRRHPGFDTDQFLRDCGVQS